MHRLTLSLAVAVAAALAAAPLDAQSRGPQRVPAGHLPPSGTCRIWYDDLPPGRQPAPMSCAEAERRAPRNARVIYGPNTSRRDDRWEMQRDDRRDDRWEDRRDDRRDDRADSRWDLRDERWEPRDDDRSSSRDEGRRRTDDSDVRRRGDDRCTSRDRSGRCVGYGAALPRMIDTRTLQLNRSSREVEQWLGGRPARARFTDADRDGMPEQIWWLDAQGRVLQRWIDDDRDGRASRVVLYENGRAVRTVT